MPQYQSTRGVQQVLSHLSELSPIEKFDLKSLTLKPVMLVALVSAQMPNFAYVSYKFYEGYIFKF